MIRQDEMAHPPVAAGAADVLVEIEHSAGFQRRPHAPEDPRHVLEVVEGTVKEDGVPVLLALEQRPRLGLRVGDAISHSFRAGRAPRERERRERHVHAGGLRRDPAPHEIAFERSRPASDAERPAEGQPRGGARAKPRDRPDGRISRDPPVHPGPDRRVRQPEVFRRRVPVRVVPTARRGGPRSVRLYGKIPRIRVASSTRCTARMSAPVRRSVWCSRAVASTSA